MTFDDDVTYALQCRVMRIHSTCTLGRYMCSSFTQQLQLVNCSCASVAHVCTKLFIYYGNRLIATKLIRVIIQRLPCTGN